MLENYSPESKICSDSTMEILLKKIIIKWKNYGPKPMLKYLVLLLLCLLNLWWLCNLVLWRMKNFFFSLFRWKKYVWLCLLCLLFPVRCYWYGNAQRRRAKLHWTKTGTQVTEYEDNMNYLYYVIDINKLLVEFYIEFTSVLRW